MLGFLRGPLLGTLVMVLFALNTLFWFVPIIILSLLKRLMPSGPLRRGLAFLADACAQNWVGCNKLLSSTLLPTRVTVRGAESLDAKGQYLVCSNHQTWNDIHILQTTFYGKLPFFKFFLKQQLIWVPVLGLAWWGLDFPFMKRYSAAQIANNPALKGKDVETTRKTCEKYKGLPVAIFNFLEGTRFTQAKHDQQRSPYRHLLKPKAGGLAFTLSAMGERLNAMVDVTIVYTDGAKTFWQYLCGHVGTVIVEVTPRSIPPAFCKGDYEGDAAFRTQVQDWVSALWAEKDARMEAILSTLPRAS
jgi:1-acyl-sn-glycerol-3-phosphate acyltransferase